MTNIFEEHANLRENEKQLITLSLIKELVNHVDFDLVETIVINDILIKKINTLTESISKSKSNLNNVKCIVGGKNNEH